MCKKTIDQFFQVGHRVILNLQPRVHLLLDLGGEKGRKGGREGGREGERRESKRGGRIEGWLEREGWTKGGGEARIPTGNEWLNYSVVVNQKAGLRWLNFEL